MKEQDRCEIVLFHIRTHPDIDQVEYQKGFEWMLQCVSSIDGFISIEAFAGEDGSELAVARFGSREAIEQWRVHPEHLKMQQRGRDEFFVGYEISIATTWKHYSWERT